MKKANLNRLLLISILFLATTAKGQTITTFAGTGVAGYSGDGGAPTAAQLNSPGYMSFANYEGTGSLYFADASNNCVRIIKIGGIIRTIAGNGSAGFSGDNGLATEAEIDRSGGIAIDKHSNVYFADQNNSRIRKVNPFGIITTYAGTGITGFYGDGGPATNAQFNRPYSVTIDTSGNLYVADQYNHRIRKIDTGGIISTVVGIGTSGFSGDGGLATAAEIAYPNYFRADTLGQLIITDNGHQRIRKVDASGIITTIAGNGTIGSGGDGGPATNAQFNYPAGISTDSYGNVYICDAFNNKVRMVNNATGIITTIAGTGTAGYFGDGGPATLAQLYTPADVIVDNHNNIYIADWYNNRIRRLNAIFSPTSNQKIESSIASFTIYPNPTNGIVNLDWSNQSIGVINICISDIFGRTVNNVDYEIVEKNSSAKFDFSFLNNGVYWVTIINKNLKTSNCIRFYK